MVIISRGNALADREAKRLAESGTTPCTMLEMVVHQTKEIMVDKMFDPLYIQKQMTHTELKEWAGGGVHATKWSMGGPKQKNMSPYNPDPSHG